MSKEVNETSDNSMGKEESKKDDAYLNVEPKEIILDTSGKSVDVKVESNTDWTATIEE